MTAKNKANEEKAEETGQAAERPQPQGELPEVGVEGGVLKEGTGDFAPDAPVDGKAEAGEGEVVLQDRSGNDVVVPLGADGESPVSPDNPPTKALLGGGNAAPGAEQTDDPKNDETEGK